MSLIKNIIDLIYSIINIRYKGYYLRLIYYRIQKLLNKRKTDSRNSYIVDNNLNLNLINHDKGYLKLESGFLNQNLTNELIRDANKIFKDRKNNYYKNSKLKALITNEEVKYKSSFYNLATNKKIINLITNYLGVVPVCTYINVWYSPKKNNLDFLEGSQLMHLDHEDFHQIKLFFFCEEVDDDTGPLIILNKKDSTKIQKKFKYNLKAENKRISDNQLKGYKLKSLTGKKGDAYLIDTSQCFHAGSRTSLKDRYIIMIQYLTPYSYMRKSKQNNLGFKFDNTKMNSLEKKIFSFN